MRKKVLVSIYILIIALTVFKAIVESGKDGTSLMVALMLSLLFIVASVPIKKQQ